MEAPKSLMTDQSLLLLAQRKMLLLQKMKNGLNWFYWIAGLSILNTFIYFVGGQLTFVIGLAATQFVDGFTGALAADLGGTASIIVRGVGLALDIGIAVIFALAGVLGFKRQRWAVIAGMGLYLLDAILYLAFKGWLGVVFHIIGLAGLWGGLKAMMDLKKFEEQAGATGQVLPQIPMPVVQTANVNWLRLVKIAAGVILAGVVVAIILALLLSNYK